MDEKSVVGIGIKNDTAHVAHVGQSKNVGERGEIVPDLERTAHHVEGSGRRRLDLDTVAVENERAVGGADVSEEVEIIEKRVAVK